MPEYTPPDATAADFGLGTYTPPEADATNFEFDPGDVLAAPTAEWRLDTPTPTATGAGTATLAAPTAEWRTDTPPPTLALTIALQAPTAEWSYAALTDTIRAVNTLAAPTAEWRLATPTPTIGYGDWVLDGQLIGRVTGETATPETLTLVTRVTTTQLLASLRALKADEGKVSVLGEDDGGFVAVDRADGDNTYALDPPLARQPLRSDRTVHVNRYEEDLISQDVGEWDVEVEVVVAEDRTDTPSISETPSADEWGLQTPLGTIATDRVNADLLGTGDDGVRRFELTARLEFDQAHVFEAAYAKLRGSRVKSIPDAPNEMRDEVGGDVTVTVDAPDGQSAVADGDYVITEWSSTRLNDRFQEIEFTIAEK